MRRNFKNTGYAYQFHRGNLCNLLSRTLNIKGAYLCLQCVCLRECLKEISKPTTDFEYLNALFTMVKNTWAKKPNIDLESTPAALRLHKPTKYKQIIVHVIHLYT